MTGPPGGSCTPAGGTCVPCTTGTVTIETKQLAVCWDTGPEGEDSEDQLLGGVEVRLSSSGGSSPASQTSGTGTAEEEAEDGSAEDGTADDEAPEDGATDEAADGEGTEDEAAEDGAEEETDDRPLGVAEFAGVAPGEYEVLVSKSGYDAPRTPPRVTVTAGGSETASVSLRRRDLECNRKHPTSEGINDGPNIWLPVFWIPWNEPWILIIRDSLWLIATAFTIVGLAIFDLSVTAYASVFVGLLSVIIFGMGLGIFLLVCAFAAFVFMILVAASSGIMAALGGPGVVPLLVAMTAATWTGFLLGLAMARQDEYTVSKAMLVAIGPAVFGLIMAAVVAAVMGESIGMVLLAMLLGGISAYVSGLLGHAFVNEGKTEAQHFKIGFYLPFAGTRYCVQGVRGMISHYGWQEFACDFAIKEGDPVLCSREGHLIAYKEDRDGTEAFDDNSFANYVKVRHEDGSIAEYFHGKQNGVTSVNPDLEAESTAEGSGDTAYREASVYVQAGQHLCEAGNVGVSMFSHIHFTVRRGPTDPDNGGDASSFIPVRFRDLDVARDEGRCWSMRRYGSDNLNRGPIEFPPDEGASYP